MRSAPVIWRNSCRVGCALPPWLRGFGMMIGLAGSCGSAPGAEVAASVGIDVRSRDFWRASLEVIKDEIDRFCALCER